MSGPVEMGQRQSAKNALLETAERLERRAKACRELAERSEDLGGDAEALLWELASRSR